MQRLEVSGAVVRRQTVNLGPNQRRSNNGSPVDVTVSCMVRISHTAHRGDK